MSIEDLNGQAGILKKREHTSERTLRTVAAQTKFSETPGFEFMTGFLGLLVRQWILKKYWR